MSAWLLGLKRCRSRSVASLLVLVAASLATAWAAAADRVVSGVVVSAAGDPLPAATVTLTDGSGKVLGAAQTNSKGVWRLVVTETAVGHVQVRVHIEGMADSAMVI